MRNLFTLFFILWLTHAYSQTHTESIIGCNKTYSVTSELQSDKSYKITITDGGTHTVSYTIKTSDLDIFANTFSDKFKSMDATIVCTQVQSDALLSTAKKLFFNIISANTDDSSNAIPFAGTLKVNQRVTVFVKAVGNDNYGASATQYDVQKIQIEINNGYIENIRAYVSIDGIIHNFNNIYGIGFTSITNYKDFSQIKLYETNSSPFTSKNKVAFYLKLNSLIDYNYDLEVDRRDYSPANIKVTINGGESVKLYKEATNKLFEAQIYTDFLGLSDNKPNGLIQTEISKDINLNTNQYESPIFLYPFFKSFGFLGYITPSVTLSKIEQNNKSLILGDLDSLRLNPGKNDTSLLNSSKHRYTTALNLYQYQSFSAGFDINILNLTNHDLKYNFNLNFGVRLGITPVVDSLTSISKGVITKTGFIKSYSVNTVQLAPQAIINFLPEERFNFSIADRLLMIKAVDNDFEVLSFSGANSQLIAYPTRMWLNVLELHMGIQLNPNSKLFGRIIFNSELQNINNNFAQIQLGYSTYILGNK